MDKARIGYVHNSVKIVLKSFNDLRQLPQKRACLFVNGLQTPFAAIRYTPDLRQYDNKIIECSYRDKQWHFLRQRTDKSFPNARGKIIPYSSFFRF